MANEVVDVLVIGAGVSGLASAAHLAKSGRSVGIVEQHRRAGMETSTHNSGVIHAGLYYPAGTLKARLCVEGRAVCTSSAPSSRYRTIAAENWSSRRPRRK